MPNLIIKMSSLGDVIHALPALTDAMYIYPDIRFDWVVEENFAEIPAWHPAVATVIPIAWRRWRKHLLSSNTYKELRLFYKKLRATTYDNVIDLQGLLKSALVTRCASGSFSGLNYASAREPLASLFYQDRYFVNPQQHAVTRMRQLLASVLGYTVPDTVPDYGIDRKRFLPVEGVDQTQPNLVFLHGTTWETKLWPESYWIDLAKRANTAGYRILLPWGNREEHARAERIVVAASSSLVTVLPRLNLAEMAGVLAHTQAVIAVDTGLGHLAAALNVPTISLYGPTNPALTGTAGENQYHLSAQFGCAPCLQAQCTYKGIADVFPACFGTIGVDTVWGKLVEIVKLQN